MVFNEKGFQMEKHKLHFEKHSITIFTFQEGFKVIDDSLEQYIFNPPHDFTIKSTFNINVIKMNYKNDTETEWVFMFFNLPRKNSFIHKSIK